MSDTNEAARAQSDLARQKIEDQAMDWLLELNGTEPGIRRWRKFDRWLSENPEHERIYCRFEENLRRLQAHCSSSTNVGPLPTSAMKGIGEPRRRFGMPQLVAAAVATVLVGAVCFFQFAEQPLLPESTIATSADESATRTLNNGVVVALGASSALSVDSRENHQGVSLLKGEARFDVPANLSKPFVVRTPLLNASTSVAGAKFVVVVGTAVSFDVKEGVIDVSAAGGEKGVVRTLKRGDFLRVPRDASRSAVAQAAARMGANPVAG